MHQFLLWNSSEWSNMQLVIKEIMDLSVRKNSNGPVDRTSQIQASSDKSSSVTVKRGAKLSFSVDRLLKSPELKHQNTNPQEKPVKDEINSAALLPGALSSACLTPPLPIRPLVSHPPPMPGSISLLQSLYVPTMYTHQVLVRPPELFGHPNPAAAYLPMHSHHPHHLNPMGNGKRKKSWTRAVFSHLQRKGLEKRFQIQKYITKPDRRQLAASLGLTDAQVKVWFQNRRMKWRHMESKERREKEKLAQETNVCPSKSIHQATAAASSSVTSVASSNSPAANFLNSNFVRPVMQPESTTNLHLSRFSSFLPPVLPPHLTSTTSATSTFYDEDSDDEDDDLEEDHDDNPSRLVMNADSTGDPEIKVD